MVYGVFSGRRANWNIHGYFTDIEKAYRYCKLKNETADNQKTYYILPIDEIKPDEELPQIDRYGAGFDYCIKTGELKINREWSGPVKENEKPYCMFTVDKEFIYGKVITQHYDMELFKNLAIEAVTKFKKENGI